MKKFFITVALIVTTITGLFAEERKWNVEYHIRTVTTDELYSTVIMNPYWQEYDWWIDEDHDNLVDYVDPYWDNDVVKTAMEKISQEEKSITKENKYDNKYVFVEISYKDSGVCELDTLRTFIMDLDNYIVWEFRSSEAALAFRKRSEKE